MHDPGLVYSFYSWTRGVLDDGMDEHISADDSDICWMIRWSGLGIGKGKPDGDPTT
jgi:hypothetical protein